MVRKSLETLVDRIFAANVWKKFANPTVNRGKTVFPKLPKDQENLGWRWDYDGELTKDGVVYHKFNCQPNAGKIPTSIKQWREKNGGTHAVIGSVLVKKDATLEEAKASLEDFLDEI
jgi:hypothetical protein